MSEKLGTSLDSITYQNIAVDFSDFGNPPDQPKLTDITAQKKFFDGMKQATIPSDQLEVVDGETVIKNTFVPSTSNSCIYFYPIEHCCFGGRPEFLLAEDWDKIKTQACGFINPGNNVMPRMIFPTDGLTYNGLWMNDGSDDSQMSKSGSVFSWCVVIDDTHNIEFKNINPIDNNQGKQDTITIKTDLFGKTLPPSKHYSFVDSTASGLSGSETTKIKSRDFVLSNIDFDLNDVVYSQPITVDGKPTINENLLGTGAEVTGTESKPYAFALVLDSCNSLGKQNANTKLSIGNVEITFQKSEKLSVKIENSVTDGGLISTNSSQKPVHTTDGAMKNANCYVVYPVWNGLFISNGNTDDKNVASAIYCDKIKDHNYNDFISPTFDDWVENKLGPININLKSGTGNNAKDVSLPWGGEMKLKFNSTIGKFAYVPVFFVPTIKFSLFFKSNQDQTDSTDTNIGTTYKHYAHPIFCKNNSDYETIESDSEGILAVVAGTPNKTDLQCWYRFDFSFDATLINEWPRIGCEIFGYIQRTVVVTSQNNVENKNGFFDIYKAKNLVFTGGALTKENSHSKWINFATALSINHSIDGTSGNIVLDKYAMMDQKTSVYQSVGGIKLDIKGGNPNIITTGTLPIFSGIAMELKENSSVGNDTIDVSLYGFEKKLTDIKIINAPFWDGDLATVAIKYLATYGGITYNTSFMDETARLPRSTNYMKPAVNIISGTTVWDAFKQICALINHKMLIQPDGQLYFYKCNDVSIPEKCYEDAVFTLDPEQIINIDVQPNTGNYYNVIFTAAYRQSENSSSVKDVSSLVNVKYTRIPDAYQYPVLPWSKVIAHPSQGFLSEEQLRKLHLNNVNISRSYVNTGSVTIPGNDSIWIFDTVSINNFNFYVAGVTHNVNFQTKEYTTSLNLCEAFKLNLPSNAVFGD